MICRPDLMRDGPDPAAPVTLEPVTELDYREIIALSKDPGVSFDDVQGRPFTTEEIDELSAFADSVFYACTSDVQVRNVIGMPVHVSVRRLARMSEEARAVLLSRLPADLADKIISQLPVAVS